MWGINTLIIILAGERDHTGEWMFIALFPGKNLSLHLEILCDAPSVNTLRLYCSEGKMFEFIRGCS